MSFRARQTISLSVKRDDVSNSQKTNLSSVHEVTNTNQSADFGSKTETEEDKKKRLRREKLEAWKRKRESEKRKTEPGIKLSPQPIADQKVKGVLTISKKQNKGQKSQKPLRKKLKKSIVFDVNSNSDDESNTNIKETGLIGAVTDGSNGSGSKLREINEKQDSADSLDSFFRSLSSENNLDTGVKDDNLMHDNNSHMSIAEDDFDDDVAETNSTIDELDANNFNDIMKNLEAKIKPRQKGFEKINHAEINYPPFKRDFYVESDEIKSLTAEEVEVLRTDMDSVKVIGKNPPNPVIEWSHLGLSASYMDILINDLRFYRPTSIQAQSIPGILQGRDIIGIAKTGSGKSLSFLLPLFRHINHRKSSLNKNPLALVMVPTRELAVQITEVAKVIDKSIKTVAVFGGENISKQIGQVSSGVHLVVATPGRLIDILSLKKVLLTNISFVVIDEADRMFDMGFQPQINMIVNNIRPDSQKLLFSATFPISLEKLARRILKYNPLEVKIGLKGVNSDIRQFVELFDKEEEKFFKLLENLGEFFNNNYKFARYLDHSVSADDKVLIFTNRQEYTDALQKRLTNKGYKCQALHGSKSQHERDTAIENFKKGKTKIMIATSIAARGLDVSDLKFVINYDPPNHIEDYVHRAGRTGRAGSKGIVMTYILRDQEKVIYDTVKILTLSKVENIPEFMKEVSKKFLASVKSGHKKRIDSGFGGKGLEKLDAKRDETKNLAKKQLENGDDDGVSNDSGNAEIVHKVDMISDFKVIEGKALNAPDAGAFHSKININDLLQTVRWRVSNKDSLKKIIDETACSITTKGKYYKDAKTQLLTNDDPKLYLLVEGDTFYQVSAAVNLIKQSIIDAIRAYSSHIVKQ